MFGPLIAPNDPDAQIKGQRLESPGAGLLVRGSRYQGEHVCNSLDSRLKVTHPRPQRHSHQLCGPTRGGLDRWLLYRTVSCFFFMVDLVSRLSVFGCRSHWGLRRGVCQPLPPLHPFFEPVRVFGHKATRLRHWAALGPMAAASRAEKPGKSITCLLQRS